MSKTILITGANGNLGTDLIQHLHKTGFTICATTGSGGLAEDLQKMTADSRSVNLTDEAATKEYIEEITHQQPGIEAAIMLVGGFAMGGIRETDSAVLDKMFALNFKTAFFTAKPLFDHFEKQGGGQFIFIGAQPALNPADGKNKLAYALSKSLVFRLAEFINEAGKGHQITATVIVPGIIDTPVNRAAMPQADFSRWVTGGQIAENIAFVLSDAGKPLRETVLKIYNES